MAAPIQWGNLTFNFDAHIQSITQDTTVWSTSGEAHTLYVPPGSVVQFTAVLDNGYILDTISVGTINADKTSFDLTAPVSDVSGPNIYTLTSKSSAPRLSVDVSTLAGWANLSAGSHNITVVAKADGFKDSAPSAAVQVTKAASTKTLAAGTYQFVENPSIVSDFTEAVSGKMRMLNANNSYDTSYTQFNTIGIVLGAVILFAVDSDARIEYSGGEWQCSRGGNIYTATDTSILRTITLATDQQVSAEFYDWAITGGNLVEQPAMPVKGDIITLDSKQYRVLKTEGTVAEVLATYDASSSQIFGSSQTYENSDLDTYCNTTFYNSLSSTMQTAIVAKTFRQDSWYWRSGTSGGLGNPIYQGTYQTTHNYRLGLDNAAFGSSINRKCYVLSIQDALDYLNVTTAMEAANTTLTSENVWKMFWNQATSPGTTHPLLRSAVADTSDRAFYVSGATGYLGNYIVDHNYPVRPAFQIDLSKISWSK